MNRSSARESSRRIVFGGFSVALGLLVMMCSSLIPILTYISPIYAGVILFPLADEYGTRFAMTAYIALSLLSMVMVTDIEAVAMLVAFFGYYPVTRRFFDKISVKAVRVTAKFSLFNAAIVLAYLFIIKLFKLSALAEEIGGMFGIALLLMGNILFTAYDRLLVILTIWYRLKLKPRLFKRK